MAGEHHLTLSCEPGDKFCVIAPMQAKEPELNIEEIIEELEAKRERLTRVIAVLNPKKERGARRGRRLSAMARKRISEGMRRNWATRKEQSRE